MFTSEMLSILSTCTSMPTGMADPAEQKTQYICILVQDNSNAFDINLGRICLLCSYRESIWSSKCY